MIRLDRFGSHVGACLLRVGFIFREFCIIFSNLDSVCIFHCVPPPSYLVVGLSYMPPEPRSVHVCCSLGFDFNSHGSLSLVALSLRCTSALHYFCEHRFGMFCFIDFEMESDLVFVDFQYFFRPHGVAFQDNANSHEPSLFFVFLDRILYAARLSFP